MMKKSGIILIITLLILFIIEGSILPWFIPSSWQTRLIPHLVYVVILYVSVYESRHKALLWGVIFGLLHDIIYYGYMIGTYSFAIGFSAYLVGLIFKPGRTPLPFMMIAVLIGSLLLDSILFGTYKLFELDSLPYNWELINHMVPNMIFHFVFALVIYVPIRRLVEGNVYRSRSQEEKG